jgi:hypothetical protein
MKLLVHLQHNSHHYYFPQLLVAHVARLPQDRSRRSVVMVRGFPHAEPGCLALGFLLIVAVLLFVFLLVQFRLTRLFLL